MLFRQNCCTLGVGLTLSLSLFLCISITCQLSFTGHDSTFQGMLCSPLSNDFGNVGTRLSCATKCDRHVSCMGFFHSKTVGRCYGVSYSLSSTQGCSSEGTNSSYRFYTRGCGAPPPVTNADISAGAAIEGDIRSYSCRPGYVLYNAVTTSTTCQSTHTWSPTAFDYCGTPPAMAYATVSIGDTIAPSARNYTCDTGYGAAGPVITTCEDGTGWTTPEFNCVPFVCEIGWHMINTFCYFTPGAGVGFEGDVFSAMDYCHSQNAYLIQLETLMESDAFSAWIFAVYPDITGWLGLSDNEVEGIWLWMNSSEPATWTNWHVGNPNAGTEGNFVRFREIGDWGDVSFNKTLQPLCETSVHLQL